MVLRDIYLRGKGTMHGKLLGVVTRARSEGSETDLSELARYVNDAVLMAPSMLLRPNGARFIFRDSRGDDLVIVGVADKVELRTVRGSPAGAGHEPERRLRTSTWYYQTSSHG